MYDSDNYAVAKQAEAGLVTSRKPGLTLGQNIDGQIAQAEKRLAELQAAKARLEASAIIDMRIDDIQAAMRW